MEEESDDCSMDNHAVNSILRENLLKCSDLLASDHVSQETSSNSQCEVTNENLNYQLNSEMPSCSKTSTFQVCKESIPCVPKEQQESELLNLGVSVYDQTEFESEVLGQVDKALKAQDELKRKEEIERELKSVYEDIGFVKRRLNHIEKAISMAPKDLTLITATGKRELSSIQKEQENKLKHLKKLEAKERALKSCLLGDAEKIENSIEHNLNGDEEMDEETMYHLKNVFAPKETEEERLIRTGEMTPFGSVAANKKPQPKKIVIPSDRLTDFDKFLLSEAEAHACKKKNKLSHKQSSPSSSTTSTSKAEAGPSLDPEEFVAFTDLRAVPSKKQKAKVKLGFKQSKGFFKKPKLKKSLIKNYCSDSEVSDYNSCEDDDKCEESDEEYVPGKYSDDDNDEYVKATTPRKKKLSSSTSKNNDMHSDDSASSPKKSLKKGKISDDGDQKSYIKRLKAYEKEELQKKHQKILESEDGIVESEEEDFAEFDQEFKVPNKIWQRLYKYQQTAVHWLWELHQQNCGGILGDEMGLGKTIQMICFLVGLKVSNLITPGDNFRGLGPVILVCPATVMHQWVKEFHTWWPEFRVAILHESGSFAGKREILIRQINRCNGVLITSYAGVVQHQESLLLHDWHYIVLDEGHKIRNPDAKVTLTAKQFRTSHRIILSGSPVQNNLKELWSLFDFIFPGKLGTLPVFMTEFSVPIVIGGYANASQVQVQIAYKCATVLRDAIKPYLLRRMKSDVKMSINLPNKNEQVLFCQLTEEQINLYKGYVDSKEVSSILSAKLQVFVGLINLRKICNHPDLFDGGPKILKDTDISLLSDEEKYGYYKRSGKMIVVEALLRLWHKQGHRVLLFTQSRQMMAILEIFVKMKGYTYMKMDGTTSISSRQPAINKFNSDNSIFVFLLTTRVGGLGVNLTGADRVVIYDPDWNPSTDAQARERAWRIGQEKQVTIYRLLTAGTIEEKIYHRQIFKQFVTNRVLKDPRQRRFFKSNDLYELFSFNELGKQGTETSAIFAGTGSEIKLKKKFPAHEKHSQAAKTSSEKEVKAPVKFSQEKLEQMKQLAKKLASEMAKKNLESPATAEKHSVSLNNDASKYNKDVLNKQNIPKKLSSEGVSKSYSNKNKSQGASDSYSNKKIKKRKASKYIRWPERRLVLQKFDTILIILD